MCELIEGKTLSQVIHSIIKQKPTMIPVGGNYSQMVVNIESKFDATNFFVLKPGVVTGYDRNEYTIKAMKKAGLKVLSFAGDQLSLGMGSSRCMTMPICRKPVK
jgi:arginine deiminase